MVFATCAVAQVPEALRRAAESRSADVIATSRVEFMLTTRVGDESDVPRTQFFTWRCAGLDHMNIDHGAEDGVVIRGPDGKVGNYTFTGPRSVLVQDGEIWEHIEDSPKAAVWNADRADMFTALDLRRLGLYPANDYADLEQTNAKYGLAPLKYSQSDEGSLKVVTCSVDGQGGFKWWIDPARDWSIVRAVTFAPDGNNIGEVRFTLRQFDGYWFPAKVEHYRLAAGETTPARVLEIFHAEFNRPEHPAYLTKEHIGVEPGMSVVPQEPGRPGGVWDGRAVVSFAEFQRKVETGEASPGVTRQRSMLRLQKAAERERLLAERSASSQPSRAPASRPISPDTEWETFTRAFVAIYGLDQEQTPKAWQVCRDCQDRAREFVEQRESKIADVDSRLASAAPGSEQREQAEKEKAKLLEPIDAIFREQLRPRLFKLLTRDQLKRGAEHADAKGDLAP